MKRLTLLLLAAAALAGCDAFSSEPTYGGLSVEGFNYTPYNLSRFVINDKYGNKASGGGDLPPGTGEGRLSCCYKLKGTEFTVQWDVYDADEAIKNIYAPIKMIHKVTNVHLAPTKVPGGAGDVVLGLHFYPDDHIEFEFRKDLSGTRIAYDEIWYWLKKNHDQLLNPDGQDDDAMLRKAARLAAAGWKKYGFTDTVDLEQFVYLTLLNSRFDEHPAVRIAIKEANGKPGAFGMAMQRLPDSVVEDIKQDRFETSKSAQHG
jgi:hypothetical protein